MNNLTISNFFNDIVNKNSIQKQENKNDILMFIKLKYLIKIPYPIKKYYNSCIPLNIYQTWHTKKLPTSMKNVIENIIRNNPAFSYHLYDDNDCRIFIKENFDENVLKAFDSLIPGAYKADLWRYCILYKKGGIYLDVKYEPVNKFKFITLTEKEHWVLDIDKNGIYNALMICRPHNHILLKAINQIVKNVKNKFYGISPLQPTGPLLLSNFFTRSQKNNLDMYHDFYKTFKDRFIFFNGYLIFKSYESYLIEHDKNKKVLHYSVLWQRRNVYK